jgi:beta-lactam-binding protein with PASTA domain
MPDLTGMYWTDVEPLLRSLGWTGALLKKSDLPDSGYPYNTIATQDPAPGVSIDAGATIAIQFAN